MDQQQEPAIEFNIKLNVNELNLILTALNEAPMKFAKNAEAILLNQAIPQEQEWIKKNQKPLLHSV